MYVKPNLKQPTQPNSLMLQSMKIHSCINAAEHQNTQFSNKGGLSGSSIPCSQKTR